MITSAPSKVGSGRLQSRMPGRRSQLRCPCSVFSACRSEHSGVLKTQYIDWYAWKFHRKLVQGDQASRLAVWFGVHQAYPNMYLPPTPITRSFTETLSVPHEPTLLGRCPSGWSPIPLPLLLARLEPRYDVRRSFSWLRKRH